MVPIVNRAGSLLSDRRFAWAVAALLTVAANLAILSDAPVELRIAGAILLVFVLPGSMLVTLLFPRAIRLGERIVLSAATSVAVSVVLLWWLSLAPIRMDTRSMVLTLDLASILFGCIALWRTKAKLNAGGIDRTWTRREKGLLVVLALVTVVSLFYTLARLSYGELVYDEIAVLNGSLEVFQGKISGMFAQPKGPAQIILAAWFMSLTGSLDEGVLRLPFALTAVVGSALFVLIARMRMTLPWVALAGVLLLQQGELLGLSRWVQFQPYVLAMMLLALYGALRGWQTRSFGISKSYWLVSAGAIGAGLLGHYDAGLIVPPVALLFLKSGTHLQVRRQFWLGAIGLGVVSALISAPFYMLLLLDPARRAVVSEWYFGTRLDVGHAPFNHLNEFLGQMWDFNSGYAQAILVPAVCIALAQAVRMAADRNALSRLSLPAIGLCAAASAFVLWQPAAFALAGFNLSFVPISLLAWLLLGRVIKDPFWQAIALWTVSVFWFTGFVMALPIDHYFAGLPPLLLIAVQGLVCSYAWLSQRWPAKLRAWRVPLLCGGASVWLALIGTYNYLQNIEFYPALLLKHPERQIPLFSQLSSPTLVYSAVYFVYTPGWRAVAALYEAGDLRGENATSEEHGRDWYLDHFWNPPSPRQRYYIDAPLQKSNLISKTPPPAPLDTYDLWGVITVAGEPQIRIFQVRDGGSPPTPRIVPAESYQGAWEQMATTKRLLSFKTLGRDDSAFYAVAQDLVRQSRAGDATVFASPEARGILSQYYSGNIPLLDANSVSDWTGYARIWAVLWGTDSPSTESQLATNLYPTSSQWEGNILLRLYGTAQRLGQREAAVDFGTLARITQVSIVPQSLKPGELLPLQIAWHVNESTTIRYKVFVHVLAAQEAPIAQADSEPLAGLRPTDAWKPGETITDRIGVWLPAAAATRKYTVVVGLYDPATGQRLPAVSSDGVRFPNDAVPVGELQVSDN